MKQILYVCAMISLVFAVPVVQTGCQSTTTLEAGGVYTDANLAKIDQSILGAAKTLDGFVSWHAANVAYLTKYPAVGELAEKVAAHRNEWIKNAYAARDAYAEAGVAYKQGKATSPTMAGVNAALSIINNITAQINTYKSQHS